MVGQRHVVTPHVELPFSQSKYAAQHVPGVYADPHVHVESCSFADESLTKTHRRTRESINKYVELFYTVIVISSVIVHTL